MPMPYGPMKPATLAKMRATRAGKPHGFALWTPERRRAVAGMGRVCADWEPNTSRWTRAQARAMSRKAHAAKAARRLRAESALMFVEGLALGAALLMLVLVFEALR